MPKRTIFTTALIASLIVGGAALAQTTPTNPQPSPTDPSCGDQVTGAGADCINPNNAEPQGSGSSQPSSDGLDGSGSGTGGTSGGSGIDSGSGTLPNTSPGGSSEGGGSGSSGSGTGSGGSSSGGSGN